MKAYDRITFAMQQIGHPVATHEFSSLRADADTTWRDYIGYSEATIGRRQREMVHLGILASHVRQGKHFKEFELAKPASQAPSA